MSCYLAIPIKGGGFESFLVPKEVFVAYRQLEYKVIFGFDEDKFNKNIKGFNEWNAERSTQELLGVIDDGDNSN